MLSRWVLPVLGVPFLLLTPAHATDQSGATYVQKLYADKSDPGKNARYSTKMAALWAACERKAEKTDDICMDSDFFVQGQDFELKDIKVEAQSDDGKTAHVTASFKNFDKPTTVVFDLVKEKKGWGIEEMTSGCQKLTDALNGKYCDQQ